MTQAGIAQPVPAQADIAQPVPAQPVPAQPADAHPPAGARGWPAAHEGPPTGNGTGPPARVTFPLAPQQSPPDWRVTAAHANAPDRDGPASPWAEPPQRPDPALDHPTADRRGADRPASDRPPIDPVDARLATGPPAWPGPPQAQQASPAPPGPPRAQQASPAPPAPALPATPGLDRTQAIGPDRSRQPRPLQPEPGQYPVRDHPPGIAHQPYPAPNQPAPNQAGFNQAGLNQPTLIQPALNQPALNQPGPSYPGHSYPDPDRAGQGYAGQDAPSRGYAGQSRAGQSQAGQGQAGQAGPGRAYPSQGDPGQYRLDQIPLDQTQRIPGEPQPPGQQLAPWPGPVPPPTPAQYAGLPLPVPAAPLPVPQQFLPTPQSPPSPPALSAPASMSPVRDPDIPTADEFARQRVVRPAAPVARLGLRGAVSRGSLGLVKLPPGAHERELLHQIEMVRRNFGGLRQVTVVNPKGGAGKTVAVLLLAMTFGQHRGGYVLAWDNNETQGTLGMRAQQDFHARTVRDLLRDLDHFSGPHGRVGDLSQYVRAQGEGMFDVLASDESATAGEMLTAGAFADIREVVSRFYKLIMVDTGNNVRAANWQAAIDATDQLVVTMSARNDSAETAARMLDHLEQSGRQRLVRQAVTVVSMPPSRKEIDLPAIRRHFAARTRAVLLAPYERLIDSGEPLRYGLLSGATKQAWLRVASAVAEGL